MGLSKLPPVMVDKRMCISATTAGNKLILTYADDTSTVIDLEPWVEAKLANVKSVIAKWDQWSATSGSGNANLVFNYPATGMVGVAFNWTITGGTPNASFKLTANDAASGLSSGNLTLDAQGKASGQATPSKEGSYTVSAVFSTGQIAKNIAVAANPAIPTVYNPTVNYPLTAAQNTAFSWSITGGKPLSVVRIVSNQSGLNFGNVTLDQNGSTGQLSTPLFYGPGSVSFTFEDNKVITKTVTVYAAAGTVLSEYCEGFNLMRQVADGNGGVNAVLVQANNVEVCGYLPPQGASGIPLNLYSSIPGGKSICVLDFPWDGTWHTYEYKTPPGNNAQFTEQTGQWLPNEAIGPGRDDTGVGKFEIFSTVVSCTHNGVPFDPYGYSPWCNQWFNLGAVPEGMHQSQHIQYLIDQGYYPNETCVIVYDIQIRWVSDQTQLMRFRITMTANAACFSADTWFRTPNGDRLAASLKVGEVVSAFSSPSLLDSDDSSWMSWTSPVADTDIDANQTAVVQKADRFSANESIKINGFHTTLWHMHLVARDGLFMWKRASAITYEDKLVGINKELIDVTVIEMVVEPHDFIYIDVEDLDTMIVRHDSTYILTHNAS